VKLLYKKGDETEFYNYRPVSRLTSFYRIIKIIIYKRLCCNFNNNILVNEQFGFREKLPTETAPYTLLNNVLLSSDLKKLLAVYCANCKKRFIALTVT